jgi:type IV pilus assembly protein PilB
MPSAAPAEPAAEVIPTEIIELMPESVARECGVLPVAEKDGKLVVRMSDPNDIDTIEKLRFILNRQIEVQPGSAAEIAESINQHYPPGDGGSADSVLQEFCDSAIDFTESESTASEPEQLDVQLRASHVVLQPESDIVSIQYLIEDKLHRRDCPPRRLHAAICSRLQILAKLNIRRDELQFGTIKVTVGDRDVDIRIVMIPTPEGLAIVLRLLPAPMSANCEQLLTPWLQAAAAANPEQAAVVIATLCH